MNYGVFFCILLSHVVADFMLQSDAIVAMRNDNKPQQYLKGNFIHAVIVLIILIICTSHYIYNYFSFFLILLISLISIIHFFIDLIKSFLISIRPFFEYSIFYFIIDQLIHIFTIFIFSIVISINLSGNKITAKLFKAIFLNSTKFNNITLTYNEKCILAIFLFITGVWSVSAFINMFFKYLKNKEFKSAINKGITLEENLISKNGVIKGGYHIGILERFIIITIIVLLEPEIIGFVLATKSIARYKKFDNDSFTEYFIMGTFISFICAIIIGIIIKNLNIIQII